MYFISYLADVLTTTNFFALPPNLVLNRFTEAPRDNLSLGVIWLYLTDNLTMTNFLLYPLTFSWA